MALGLSGASIGSAFNLIVSLFPPVARFSIGILLFIALHLVNMFLSFLSGYVHGARLILWNSSGNSTTVAASLSLRSSLVRNTFSKAEIKIKNYGKR